MQPVLLVPVEYVLVLQQVRILADVLTAWKSVTLLDMLECEEALMSLTHVVRPEVYRGTVSGSCVHHVQHDFGHVYLITSRELLLLISLFVVVSLGSR